MVSDLDMSGIVPLRRSAIRRLLPSTGSRRVSSPASSVVRGVPTACRPSRRASLPSLGSTALCACTSLPSAAKRHHRRPGASCKPAAPLCRSPRGDGRLSQVPGGTPLRTCPALRPRWDLCARPSRRFGAAFRHYYDVSSHDKPLAGLNHTACTLAVYASSPGSPLATQDSLPAAGQLCRAGLVTRWVPSQGFRACYISSSLPRLGLAHNNSG